MRRGLRHSPAARALALFCVVSLTLGCGASASPAARPPQSAATPEPPPASAPPPTTVDPIVALNDAARASYRAAKERILARLGPTILVEGDKLILLRDGRREEAEVRPRGYHDLKALDHIPLALEAILGDVDGPIDEPRIAALRDLRARLAPAAQELLRRDYPASTLAREAQIVSSSTALIDAALASRATTKSAYARFARDLGPLLLASVAEAAKVELDAIHKQVTVWKTAIPAREWRELHVVILGAHMARDQSLELQYFERALDESAEGRRIVFAEGLSEERKALDLLATHMLDARLGEAFFGDSARMHRDVLGEAAAAYLSSLFPSTR